MDLNVSESINKFNLFNLRSQTLRCIPETKSRAPIQRLDVAHWVTLGPGVLGASITSS